MFCLVEGLDARSWRRWPGRSLTEKESSNSAVGVHRYSKPLRCLVAKEAPRSSVSLAEERPVAKPQ
jgi:hypothetical protein